MLSLSKGHSKHDRYLGATHCQSHRLTTHSTLCPERCVRAREEPCAVLFLLCRSCCVGPAGSMIYISATCCLFLSVVLLGAPRDSEGCVFEVERVILRPSYVKLYYRTESVSSIQCNVDDSAFMNCPDGVELILEEGGVHSFNFAIACDNGSTIMPTPLLLNTKPPNVCEFAKVSRIQLRKSFDVHRTLTFSWRTTGDVDYVKCRVGQDDEFETTNPYELPLFDRCESRMIMTVTAFCNGRAIANRTRRFHNFNGLSCDHGCSNISFSTVPTTTYSAANSTVAVDYTTSVPAICGCRARFSNRFSDCAEVPVREPSGLVIISCRTVDGCKTVIRNYIEYA